jgi:hypothetical protein
VEPGIFSIFPVHHPVGAENSKPNQSLASQFPLPPETGNFPAEPGIKCAEPGIK